METPLLAIILLFILTPVLVIYLEGKYAIMKKIGAVLVCYGVGIIVGNMGVLPEGAEKYQNMITDITIPLALPLILFSLDIKAWFKMAGDTFISLLIGVVTLVIMVFVGFWIYKGKIDNIWMVAGMLVAVYSGGTPNMAAMKSALDVPQELYIMTHTYDMALGALYLVFILTFAQRVFLLFLPAYKSPVIKTEEQEFQMAEDYESYSGFFSKKTLLPLLGALGVSVLILAVSFGISRLILKDFQTASIILLITTFGIAMSFIPQIKQIKKTFQLGMYLILIFCITVASMADISKLSNISFSLFYYVALVMFGAHFLHAFVAKFFKIDADTVIVSGVGLVCSPPFVPMVAGALKNREVILTGIIVGIAGYAIGNYLGVGIAYLLRYLL